MAKTREIHWAITNGCNLPCIGCIQNSGLCMPNELTYNNALKVLNIFKSQGIRKIFFTGGEPYFRPDFRDILSACIQFGFEVSIITNGTLVTPEDLQFCLKTGIILAFSLDGGTSESNDRIRGKGSFATVGSLIQRCQSIGLEWYLYITVSTWNLKSLEEVFLFARANGCSGIHINEITLGGRAHSQINLGLRSRDRGYLISEVRRLAKTYLSTSIRKAKNCCWADGSALYMMPNGALYACSEISQCAPDKTLGNILETPFPSVTKKAGACNYELFRGYSITLLVNAFYTCSHCLHLDTIHTLDQLYQELETFYPSQLFEQVCRRCSDPDCMGYIWILDAEIGQFLDRNIPLIQINDGPVFLDSFSRDEYGKIMVDVRYPLCKLLQNDTCRTCSVHEIRPFVCRLWPIGLETENDGTIVWALHRDCLFVRELEKDGKLQECITHAQSLLERISPQLRTEIIQTCMEVDDLTVFPDGGNSYSILRKEVIRNVKVQGCFRFKESQKD